jgi:hypothetical protein
MLEVLALALVRREDNVASGNKEPIGIHASEMKKPPIPSAKA